MSKKWMTLFVLVGFVFSVKANPLDQSINNMLSNVTQSQTISSNMRGGFIGGSAYVRMPNSTINLFNIDVPRVSAGCGGIDATLGGFSYISAQKLMDFFRKVIQQAVPVAFQLALQQMSPQIAQTLKDFQNWAQRASALSSNSCQLATGIASSAVSMFDSAANQSNNLGNQWESAKGLVSDAMEAADKVISNPGGFFQNLMSSAPKDSKGNTDLASTTSCSVGNMTWCALNQKQSQYGFIFGLDADENISKEILMSLIGTRIIATSDPSSETAQQTLKDYTLGTLELKDLISLPKNGNLPILSCGADTDKCLTPSVQSVPFYGVEGYVNNMLFGTNDPSGVAAGQTPGVQAGSIISNMSATYSNSQGPCSALTCYGFTQNQITFLNSIANIPVLAYLTKVQHDPNMLFYVGTKLVPLVVNYLGAVYGQNVYSLSRSIYQNSANQMPDDYKNRMSSISVQLAEMTRAKESEISKMQEIIKQIDVAYKTMPELQGFKRRASLTKQ